MGALRQRFPPDHHRAERGIPEGRGQAESAARKEAGQEAVKALWVLTLLSAVAGAFLGIIGILEAKGAPQEASAAAIALAIAVIPYCFTRACEKVANVTQEQLTILMIQGQELKKTNEILTVHTRLLAQIANVSADTVAVDSEPKTDIP